jgi:hypothetical protein
MANKTFKLTADKMGGRQASDYIGNEGEIFYDPTTTSLRMSDGSTAGGLSLGGADTGDIVFDELTMYSPDDEDLYVRAGDDLYLDAIGDDVHIRAEDDVRIKVGYDFEADGSTAEWRFDRNGFIQFPDDTQQSTAYAPVTESWTVTTGTNTYSFTVPSDGTYVMWVKGNIPNGIITWNATVSVSNSNVPAIGTQYAWNYTGGGSPILLTAIPDQIKGVAGTISTDATYVGTTSNRFDFGISNTSGASQTVFYGYIKI